MTGATREELYAFLGVVYHDPPVLEATSAAYFYVEQLEHEERPATSFQAGWFPYGDELDHCARYQMYSLMNVPGVDEVADEYGRGILDAGKDLEAQITRRWESLGIMLTGSLEQTSLTDPEHWISGYPDAILDLRDPWGWPYAQPVEIKGKDSMVLKRMVAGEQGVDPYHAAQAVCYAHMERINHAELFAHTGLLPAIGASVLYVARDRPGLKHQFFVEIDAMLLGDALTRLSRYQEHWEKGELPPRDPSWKWGAEPCAYCEFKRDICRIDNLEKVDRLEGSNAARLALVRDPEWTLEAQRMAVAERWIIDSKEEVAV